MDAFMYRIYSRQTIIVLAFLFLTSPVYALDCWLNIQTTDKIGIVSNEEVAKYGDVINIRCDPAYEPPPGKGREVFSWVKVDGLTQQEADKYVEKWVEPVIEQENILLSDSDIQKIVQGEIVSYGTRQVLFVGNNLGKQNGANGIEYNFIEATLRKEVVLAYRRNEFDVNKYSLKNGVEVKKLKQQAIKNDLRQKTQLDLVKYEAKRVMYAYLQRPAIQLANIVIPRAQAADNVSKICAVGANCSDEAYNDLVDWEAATDNDLVTATAGEIAEIYNDDGDVPAGAAACCVTVSGATVNSTYFRQIRAATGEKHNGTDNGAATIADTSTASSNNGMVQLHEDYLKVYNLILYITEGHTQYYAAGITANSINDAYFYNNVVHGANASFRYTSGFGIDSSTSWAYVYNNIFYDLDDNEDAWCFRLFRWGSTGRLYANTCHTSRKGFGDGTLSTTACKNNIEDTIGTTGFVACSTSSTGNSSDGEEAPKGLTQRTGTVVVTAANKLIDLTASFDSQYLYARVRDTTDSLDAYVTAVDSATQLSISADLFTGIENWSIYKAYVCAPTYVNEAGDNFQLDTTDTCAQTHGADLDADTPAITDDIMGDTRDTTTPDIGADEFASSARRRYL